MSPTAALEALRLAKARALVLLIPQRNEAHWDVSQYTKSVATLKEKYDNVRDTFRPDDEIYKAHRALEAEKVKLLQAQSNLEALIDEIDKIERTMQLTQAAATKVMIARIEVETAAAAAVLAAALEKAYEGQRDAEGLQRELQEANEKINAENARRAADKQARPAE